MTNAVPILAHIIHKHLAGFFVASVLFSTVTLADVTDVKDALGVALKQKPIAAAGEKMKLYSLSANYNGDVKRWIFQFYDGGANLHSVTVDKTGKARYHTREKSDMRIFSDVDFSKLPSPKDVLMERLIEKGKAALAALKFETLDNGKLYLNYHVRSEIHQRDKAYHEWTVTIPVGDGKKGKTVAFKNGQIDTINNSTLYGG